MTPSMFQTFWCTDHVKLLGVIWSVHGMYLDPEKTANIRSWSRLDIKLKLQIFFGLIIYFSNHLQLFLKKRSPSTWEWDDTLEHHYIAICTLIEQQYLLKLLTFEGKFNIKTDAGNIAGGAELMERNQKFNGEIETNIIAFTSFIFKDNQKFWSVARKELFTAIQTCKKFSFYISGRSFTLLMDSRCIATMANQRTLNGQYDKVLVQWLVQFLEEFPLVEIYPIDREYNAPANAIGALQFNISLQQYSTDIHPSDLDIEKNHFTKHLTDEQEIQKYMKKAHFIHMAAQKMHLVLTYIYNVSFDKMRSKIAKFISCCKICEQNNIKRTGRKSRKNKTAKINSGKILDDTPLDFIPDFTEDMDDSGIESQLLSRIASSKWIPKDLKDQTEILQQGVEKIPEYSFSFK
eukprot:gene980-9887_t